MKRADSSQKSLVIDILTKSFDDNKSVNYVVKQGRNRQARIRGLMEYSFQVCNAFGDVWISNDTRACALVLYPDKKHTTAAAIISDLVLASSVIGLSRVPQVLSRESKIKSLHPKIPFTYLWFIGVAPEFQNKGAGSQLLSEVMEKSVADQRPIYLETSVDRNLPWYKKHGFEIFNELDFSYKLYLLRKTLG
jgi:ribosomal protein S18 acetylase RimI-like enzyme